MPKGSTQTRKKILKKKAQPSQSKKLITMNVRMANKMAEETENGVMVQDTAWDGYEKIPTWIMQGYGTMALEASQQLRKFGSERPSHVLFKLVSAV